MTVRDVHPIWITIGIQCLGCMMGKGGDEWVGGQPRSARAARSATQRLLGAAVTLGMIFQQDGCQATRLRAGKGQNRELDRL